MNLPLKGIQCVLLMILFFAKAQGQDPAGSLEETAETQTDIVVQYDRAVAYLESICEDYRLIKAIELSQKRNISTAEAYKDITPVMPLLDPINRELLNRPIYDPAEIDEQKREIEKVEMLIDMMIELAAKLLDEIENVQMEIIEFTPLVMDPLTLEQIVQMETFDPEAMEDIEERQVDQEMQELAEMAKQQETAEQKDLTEVMQPLIAPMLPNIEDMTEENDDDGRDIRMDLMVSRSADNAPEQLNSIVNQDGLNKLSARKIKFGGSPVEWLFVDTWYTVGPFPNPSRANINRQFPPESIIDLDATYAGKGGERIKWEFVQSPDMPIVPANDESYAIYYAYTEIFLDQPMDLWVAIGCDDKANVWLNGLPIYNSGDQLKGWRPNEAFRKVSFLPGVNRVLFRVENGWMGTAFSFAIRTTD